MAIDVTDPMHLDLTEEFLRENGLQPFVAGDDLAYRFSARNALGEPLALTGALIVMHIRLKPDAEAALVTRRSDVGLGGSLVVMQITPDPDQTAEDLTDPANPTGKSWYTVRFSDEDEAVLLTAVGKGRVWGKRIKFADGTERTVFQGLIDILRPNVRPSL